MKAVQNSLELICGSRQGEKPLVAKLRIDSGMIKLETKEYMVALY